MMDLTNTKYIKWFGRTYYDKKENITYFNFSASGFEVSFYGTKVSATIIATNTDNINNKPYLSVLVDDETNIDKAIVIELNKPKQNIVLIDGLKKGNHKIKVYKRSECEVSHTGIQSIETDGTFLPITKERKLKIEIYGDSLTCGYQVEGKKYDEEFSTKYENSLKSYGFYASNELNAELSLICAGGFPIYKSEYTKDYNIKTIPDMFDMADFDTNTTLKSYKVWDHTNFIPDIVVINLGANDGSSYVNCKTDDEKNNFICNFKEKYIHFVDKINNTYNNVPIIAYTTMIEFNPNIKLAIKDVINKYDNVFELNSNCLKVGGIMPGRGHPNNEMQKYAGHELAILIKDILNSKIQK